MRTLSVGYEGTLVRRPWRCLGASAEALLHREGRAIAAEIEQAVAVVGFEYVRVVHIDVADPIRATLRVPHDVVVGDLADVAERLAALLHVARVDVSERAPGYAVLRFLAEIPDPWAVPIEPAVTGVASVHDALYLGRTDDGEHRWWSLVEQGHGIVQGQTRSGKTTALYGLLGQLAEARDVIVGGCDPSGLLLGPWARRRDHHAGWQAIGTGSVDAHVHVLERLVRLMDERIARLPDGRDAVEISDECPLIVCVLEEWPGLVTTAGQSSDRKLKTRLLGPFFRLLAEGAKAGIRVVLVAQRADADIIGGYQRGQLDVRMTFRMDNGDGVRMLHPAVTPERVQEHVTAVPGECLLTRGGTLLERLRTPYCRSEEYWSRVIPPAADNGNVIGLSA